MASLGIGCFLRLPLIWLVSRNFFNLINPDYVFLAHTLVVGIVGLGHFLVILGLTVMLVGLAGAAYIYLQSRNPRWRASGFRRTFLIVTIALMLLAVGSTAWVTSAVSYQDKLAAKPGGPSSSAGQREEHYTDCEVSPAIEQQEAADKLAAETKAGVAKYVDLSAAEADGYQPSSPSWRPITHYLNPGYHRDGEILDPDRPEALVYANTSEGAVLLGAMYLMSEPGDSGPQIGGCLTQWHAHSLGGVGDSGDDARVEHRRTRRTVQRAETAPIRRILRELEIWQGAAG